MFNLQLSISIKAAQNKEAALKITKFEVKDVNVEEDVLKALFTQYLYSGNQWIDGACKNTNFKKMSAIILDADQGYTVSEARELFKDFHYIIHTSSSHMADIEGKGGKQERFRVILPLAPDKYDLVGTPDLAAEVYLYLFDTYKWADTSCKDSARKFFPFLNKLYPDLFELHINKGREYFPIDLTQVAVRQRNTPATQTTSSLDHKYIYLNDEFILGDRKTKVRLRDITKETDVFCIFCDDYTNGRSRSAVLNLNAEGKKFLYCQHCKKTYWTAPEDERGEVFYLGNQLMKILANNSKVAITPISRELFNDMSLDRKQTLFNRVAKYRTMPAGSFTINYVSDSFADTISYELDVRRWELNIKTPPLPIIKKDNDYINEWLDDLFGQYSEFVKDWMALFCYTNYKQLPSFILNGIRGSGKSTFGELMKDIFPNMGAEWTATGEDFTEYFQKKLLLVEENTESDKRDQYTNIKKVSGADTLTVNIKYGAKFEVKKNANIILLSNAARPLFVVSNEDPKNEHENQFFMLTFTRRPKKLNSRIKHDLRDRIGYYVRTELRKRYTDWVSSDVESQNRYSLPVPITPDLLYVYESSRTAVDEERDDIYDILKFGRTTKDRMGDPMRTFGPYDYITFTELKDICAAFNFRQNPTTYKKHLQDAGLIDKTENRSAGQRLGYKVLQKEL
jgi:hypothetical protein